MTRPGLAILAARQRLLVGAGDGHAVAEALQHTLQVERDQRLILDHQHGGGDLAADLVARLAQQRLDPLRRHLQDLGRLLRAEALDAHQQEGLPYFRGERRQRACRRMSLFAAAVALPIAVGPIVLLTGMGGWLFSAAAMPLPVALGFAVLARGLYDLKTAANRGLVWLILSALVVGVYALVIAGAGSCCTIRGELASLAGGSRSGGIVHAAARCAPAGHQSGHLRPLG